MLERRSGLLCITVSPSLVQHAFLSIWYFHIAVNQFGWFFARLPHCLGSFAELSRPLFSSEFHIESCLLSERMEIIGLHCL